MWTPHTPIWNFEVLQAWLYSHKTLVQGARLRQWLIVSTFDDNQRFLIVVAYSLDDDVVFIPRIERIQRKETLWSPCLGFIKAQYLTQAAESSIMCSPKNDFFHNQTVTPQLAGTAPRSNVPHHKCTIFKMRNGTQIHMTSQWDEETQTRE